MNMSGARHIRSNASSALGLLLLVLMTPHVWAQRVAVRESDPSKAAPKPLAPTTRTVPRVVQPPRTLDDLRELQSSIQNALKLGLKPTVAITSRLGQGSGVIVRKDGLILTAGHVAKEGGFEVTVTLSDGRRVRARVLGINRSADAGMVKIIDKGEYAAAEIGSSNDLKIGQWAIALGHPGGYRRDRPPVLRLGRIIQTDPKTIISTNTLVGGDSGGPLFDLEGRVIGIHSRIGESTVANLHVPIGVFLQDWDRMVNGDVWGALPTPKGTSMLGIFTVDHKNGALVQSMLPNSPAAKAGLKVNDVITGIDGQKVSNRQDLIRVLDKRKPDEVVQLDILRDGQSRQIKVKLSAG